MKEKEVEYFPHLPYSVIEDNKRCQQMLKTIKNDPFTYHKKKSTLTNLVRVNSQDDIGDNQELLFFQKRHDKDINSYNNFMQKKNATIDLNARNYLHYIVNNKQIRNRSRNPINYNNLKENIDSNINVFPTLNNMNNKNMNTINNNEEIEKRRIFFNNKKSFTKKNIFNTNNNQEFIPGNIKKRRTDITDPSYFNGIGEEIMKINNEIMNYNLKEAEKKFNQKRRYSRNEDISIGPEKIRNRNYYDIGESKLNINPILNKGSYFENELKNRNNNYRKKSDIMII